MLSLNQHIKIFSDFQASHQQLNSFGFGDPWEWYEKLKQGDENLRYPAMFVSVQPTQRNGHEITRSYKAFFVDRERKAEEDEEDVLSDMEICGLEFLTYVEKVLSNTSVNVTPSSTLNPLTESGVDYLSGYELDFSLVESFDNNSCSIPLSSSDNDVSQCPSAAVTNSNNTYTLSVAAGEAEVLPNTTITVKLDGITVGTGTVVTLDPAAELIITW